MLLLLPIPVAQFRKFRCFDWKKLQEMCSFHRTWRWVFFDSFFLFFFCCVDHRSTLLGVASRRCRICPDFRFSCDHYWNYDEKKAGANAYALAFCGKSVYRECTMRMKRSSTGWRRRCHFQRHRRRRHYGYGTCSKQSSRFRWPASLSTHSQWWYRYFVIFMGRKAYEEHVHGNSTYNIVKTLSTFFPTFTILSFLLYRCATFSYLHWHFLHFLFCFSYQISTVETARNLCRVHLSHMCVLLT